MGLFVGPSLEEMAAYIRQAAAARGMDPDKVVRVARTEGLGRGVWQSNVRDKRGREPSYGPFQMLVGGGNTGFPTGMGNKFEAATGLRASDPANWQRTVDYALNTAAKEGWRQWYGPKNAGLGNWYGIKQGVAEPVPLGPPPTASQYDPLSSVGTRTPSLKNFASHLFNPGTGPQPGLSAPTTPSGAPPAAKGMGLMGALAALGAGLGGQQQQAPQAPPFQGIQMPRGDASIPQMEYPRAQLPVWGGGPQENPEDQRMKQLLAMLGRG